MDKVYINPETQAIEYVSKLNSVELEIDKQSIIDWDIWVVKWLIQLVLEIKDKTDRNRHKGLDKRKEKLEILKKELWTNK